MVPFLVCIFVEYHHLNPLISFIRISTSFCTFSSLILMFVPWKKGPECWTKISAQIFTFLVYFSFLVLPFLNFMWIIINLFYFINGSPWYLQSFEIFFVVLNGCKIIEFFTTIRPFYINEYKIYL